MPLQMYLWLLVKLLLMSSLKAVAALLCHTEIKVHEVLHVRSKVSDFFLLQGIFCYVTVVVTLG